MENKNQNKNAKIAEIFSQNFKFECMQEVRHKADSKEYSEDMGLLILHRLFYETQNDDGEKLYERTYICRQVQFSGSGQTCQFSEKELLSITEYDEQKIKRQADRNRTLQEVKQSQKEVYAAFGVTTEDYLYLKKDGEVQKDRKYRVCGFSQQGDEIKIYIREVLMDINIKIDTERKELTSKDQFEVIKD